MKTRNLRLQLDALVLVMLCFPPTVRSVIVEAAPRIREDDLKTAFAFYAAAAAVDIFADRLESLTVLSNLDRNPSTPRAFPSRILCGKLDSLKTLTLDLNDSHITQGSFNNPGNVTPLHEWHDLPPTVTRLAIWNLVISPDTLVAFVKGFPSLTHLTLAHIDLDLARAPPRHVGDRAPGEWLHFLISLRRAMPVTEFEVRDIAGIGVELLGESAVRWMFECAVPVGSGVSFERETRVVEDFESFLPLWSAEDSIRGKHARIAREDGKLVDAAMGSRWRGLHTGGVSDW